MLAQWTAIPGLAALSSAAVGVAVDADENIIIAGDTVKAGVKTQGALPLVRCGCS